MSRFPMSKAVGANCWKVGGSARSASSTSSAIQMQAKNQPVVALLQWGRYRGLRVGDDDRQGRSLQNAEGSGRRKIGVTSPGSNTHFVLRLHDGARRHEQGRRFVHRHRHPRRSATARRAEIDAIVSTDPMMTLVGTEKLVKIVADTRAPRTARMAVLGGPYPGGVIYATPALSRKIRQAVQKVVNAFHQRAQMDRQTIRPRTSPS